jgi:hypothetical protein
MRVTGDADGTFDAGDAIEFYATGQDTPSTDAHVYWLVAGNRPGLRIRTLDFAGDAEGPAGASNFWSTVQRKDRSVYFAALKNGDAENWFGPVVSADPTDLTLNLDHIDGTAAAPAQLTVAVQGVTTSADGSAEHAVGVLVNGVDVGELRFQGQGHPQNTFDVPASALIEGTNTVTLVARGGEVDLSLLDFIRVSYWHTFTADADLLRFTVNRPGRVTVSGFASPSIHVVDITNTCAVKELSGAVSTDASGSSSITVGVTVQGERTLLAYSDATAAVPAYIEPNTPSTWHLPTEAHDYVIITHRDFADAVQPLIERRTQEGHNAATIVLDDVYDEFSYGEKSPQAIRDFLQWANTNWEFAPRFVVLVGDATIDPRDYAGLGDADFVPTKQVPMTQIALESASDDWFVDFNDDGLPEIAIGRLPVRTPEHAQSMIAKIVGYGTGAVQSWAQQVMLVADRNDDTSDFEQYSRNLTSVLPSGYTAHEVFRGTLGDAVAHEALLDGVNEGRLIVNYSGHGSTRIWGSNGELLTNEGVADWQNTDRLPFVVAMNCLNGLFDSVWDEESLAEALMRAPNTGAVAAWASSSVTPSATQSLINAELFRLIFAGRYATLGEAVVAAKGAVSKSDLRRSWIFFGDPAMQLVGVPRPIVDTTTPPTPVVDEPTTPPPAPTAEQLAALDARGRPLRLRDLSGDGRADMYLYAVETGNWSAVINTGSDSPLLRSGTWAAGWQVLAADLDGNGRADLMFCKPATGEWVQAFATSDDGFVYTQGTMPAGGARAQLAVGDFNADKRDDVLVYDAESGRWTIAVSDGRGNFTYRRGTWPAGLRTIVADFDGNKRADVFGYDATSGHAVLEMSRRDEQFQAVPSSWPAGLRVSVGRLDRNSSSDLFFYNPATGDWQAAFNDGSGGFTSRSGSLPAGLEIHLGDLDGDRVDDLFGYNPATGETVTGLNAASGDFAVTTTYWAVGFSVATGDVDGDGRVDVALYDPATGVWFQCTSMGSGVFAFSSGTWLSNAAFVGSPR